MSVISITMIIIAVIAIVVIFSINEGKIANVIFLISRLAMSSASI